MPEIFLTRDLERFIEQQVSKWVRLKEAELAIALLKSGQWSPEQGEAARTIIDKWLGIEHK